LHGKLNYFNVLHLHSSSSLAPYPKILPGLSGGLMKTRKSPLIKTDQIHEQITSLFEELQLAIQWQRPSILMVTYRSKLVLLDTQISLKNRLRKIKQSIFRLEVNNENYDIALFLMEHPQSDKTIFYISGLANGGGAMGLNAYRALNIRRELLVDHRIRVIFWLTEQEAATLMTNALDFWAFRHRMIELPDQPRMKRISAIIKSLNWQYWDKHELQKEIPDGFHMCEELLGELPELDSPEMRAEIIHMLAGFHWAMGEYEETKKMLEKGFELIRNHNLFQLEARYHIGFGKVELEQNKQQQALNAYNTALKLNPNSAEAFFELGMAYRSLQQSSSAKTALEKAVELDPTLITAWKDLGDILFSAGEFSRAIQAYRRYIAKISKDALIWTRLGTSYLSIEKPDEALPAFKKARDINKEDPNILLNIGLTYQDLGFFNKAIRAFYKVTRMDPSNAIPWKQLGDIYNYNNRIRSAQNAYRQALILDPHLTSAQKSLDLLQSKTTKPGMSERTGI
jgi:tetratricopeptide (TPR) repeat protein